MGNKVKKGDTIAVEYTGKLQTGKVFDTSEGKLPLKFTVGSGMLIKGFESAVIGMKVGEKKTIVIEPEDGYGIRNEDLYADIPLSEIPEDLPLTEGVQVELQDPQGRPFPAFVSEIGKDK